MAKVKEVMSRQVVSIAASDSCLSAVERIHRSRVGHLPDDRVVGILTETDMLRLIVRSDACAPECAEVIVSFPS
jgi:predicted transcriptional regulator